MENIIDNSERKINFKFLTEAELKADNNENIKLVLKVI
jgi:hypothetical protein